MSRRPRAGVVGTVYRKEIIDTLRDRRTLATMVLVPMVTYPLMLIVASEAALVEREAAKNRTGTVAALTAIPRPIIEAVEGDPSLRWTIRTGTTAPADRIAHARHIIDSSAALVVIAASSTAAPALDGLGTARIALFYDETEPGSRDAAERIEDLLDKTADRIRGERLARMGVTKESLHPILRSTLSIATRSEVGGELASRFLPMLILVFIAISCFYPAIELTAGEKERGTLATLLTAPVHAAELVAGKYLAVVTIGTLAGLLNVVVMTLTVMRAMAGVSEHTGRGEISALPQPTPTMIIGLLIAVLLVAALVGAVMIVAATFARSFRDANNLLTPVLLVVMMPAFLASFPSAELDARWAAVPIAGVVLWMKALLLGRGTWDVAVGVIGASIGASVLLLGLATRIFGDERALFASEGRRADARTLFLGAPDLGPGSALAFASMLFIGNYFLSAFLLQAHPLVAVAILQIGLHFGLSYAFVRWTKAPDLWPLGRPWMKEAYPAAILFGLLTWVGVSIPLAWIVGMLVPGQDAAAKALESQLDLSGVPLPLVLIALAVLPAIAEELAFRGVVLGALRRRMSTTGALVLQAILFGLLHGSLFRLLPTAVLGLFLGLLAVRSRSLWPSIVAHALNNAVLVTLDRLAPEAIAGLGTPSAAPLPVFIGLMGLAIVLARRLTDQVGDP